MGHKFAHDPALLALLNSITHWRNQRCDLLLQGGRLGDAHALVKEFMDWESDLGEEVPS